jgi:Xaa-Pro aminopeptidase
LGPSPISSLGAGFAKVKPNEPVLVDIVHVHRGYVSDCTRIFHEGKLSDYWIERLEDMNELSDRIVSELGKGLNCSKIWDNVTEKISELGYSNNLMGMKPNQAKFVGHSVGLELDETPVIAKGFDRPLEKFGVMAVEPKVVFSDGVVGIEDTWVRGNQGMECVTAGSFLPPLMEW